MVPVELKQAYGVILAREPDPWKAALTLIPDDMGRSLWVNDQWRADPEVLAYRDKERERIAEDEQATKADLKREVWARVISTTIEEKDRVAAMKLYADLIGAIEKPGPSIVNNNNVLVPKVISLPTFDNDEDWETKAEQQQRDLLNVATSRH